MALKFDKNLKPDKWTEAAARTYPGMAHWAGTGPDGKVCRQCKYFGWLGHLKSGVAKKSFCRKGTGVKFPSDARACRNFEETAEIRKPHSGL